MNQSNHTPLPLAVLDKEDPSYITDASGKFFCETAPYTVIPADERNIANAALIVKAVNNHQKLVDALRASIADREAVFAACRKNDALQLSVGHARRLESARALLAELEGK